MNAIVNVNESWGIGRDGQLLCNIPGDMKFFRETTKGKTVVMGRRTLESFPKGAPLKNRVNLVLTSARGHIQPEAFAAAEADREKGGSTELLTVESVPALLALLKEREAQSADVFVIGGEAVYRELLPYCDCCFVTKNNCKDAADTWFPDLDVDPDWALDATGEEQQFEQIRYQFLTYRRRGCC